ncbi:MAG TPA: hypothetical protein PKV38_15745, partial [bacterium]|nr:hypothetical protein [bacterium]
APMAIFRPYLGLRLARSGQADEFGQYRFAGLQTGQYELWASRYSIGISPVQTIEVKPGEGIECHLPLK